MLVSLSDSDLIRGFAAQLGPLWLAFLMRAWVKLFIAKRILFDDWFLLFSTVLLSVALGLGIWMVKAGLIENTGEPPQAETNMIWELWLVLQILYYVINSAIKISVAILLFRLATRTIHRRIILFVVFINGVASATLLFIAIFQCWPIDYFWDKSLQGSCISVVALRAIYYTGWSIIAFANLVFTTIPLWILCGSLVDTKSTASTVFVLSLGLFATAVSCYRISFIRYIPSHVAFNEIRVAFFVWNTLEMTVGIIAVSLATTRPLMALTCRSLEKLHMPSTEWDRNWGWKLSSTNNKRHFSSGQSSAADAEDLTETRKIGEEDIREWNRICENIRTTNTKRDAGTEDQPSFNATVTTVDSSTPVETWEIIALGDAADLIQQPGLDMTYGDILRTKKATTIV